MRLKVFARLPGPLKRVYVRRRGTFLALRWKDPHELVVLYTLPGRFLAELVYRTDTRKFRYRGAFEAGRKDDRLPDYATLVKLPEWMPEAE